MIAFHNDPTIKDRLLANLTAHAKADSLVHGHYWQGGKGCAIACTLVDFDKDAARQGSHGAYEKHFGIPRIIARLEDRIFEGLKNGKAKEWPLRFTQAIQPGADLSMVWPRFALWMLTEELPQYVQKPQYAKQKASIEAVGALYREWCDGADIHSLRERFVEARVNAGAAAYAYADAAYAYADAAAAYAYADDAADAAAAAAYAAAAAAYAADAAAYARFTPSWNSAKENHYSKMANKLIELLKEAK